MKKNGSRFVPAILTCALSLVSWVADGVAQSASDKLPTSIEQLFSEELSVIEGGTPAQQEAARLQSHRKLIEKIIGVLQEPPSENRQIEAAIALKHYANEGDLSFLVQTLRETQDVPTQVAIIETFGLLRNRSVVDPLQFVLEHRPYPSQLATIDAYGKIGDQRALPLLMQVLNEADSVELRKRAAAAMAQIGGPQARRNLEAAFESLPDGGAKRATRWALVKMQGKINDEEINNDFPEGRKLAHLYRGMLYYFYKPVERRGGGEEPWLLICVHGSDMGAEQIFDLCQPIARQYRLALLAPHFDTMRFPNYANLNIEGDRADKRLLELVDFLGQNAGVKSREVYLYGYEQGGDFAQRFTLAYPNRIARAAFLSRGFIDPSPNRYYPNGLQTSPLAPDLKFDLLPIIKTDFAVLTQSGLNGSEALTRFFEGFVNFGNQNGYVLRLRIKQVGSEDGDSNSSIWQAAHQYLFPSS